MPKDHLSDTFPISFEEGQKQIDEWFKNLPSQIKNIYDELEGLVSKFESFQLIANISHSNHLRDMSKPYDDYNEGRMAIIPEFITLMAIRKDYQTSCSIPADQFMEQIEKVNELASKYLGMSDALKTVGRLPKTQDETTLQKVTNKLTRDETWIRNPGFPDHHFEIVAELLNPINEEIKKKFGFSVEESIIIRKNEINFLNQKFAACLDDADTKGASLKDEVVKFRNTGYISQDSLLSRAQFLELKDYSSKKLKPILAYHFRNEVFYHLQDVYSINLNELAAHCGLPVENVKNFIEFFSCNFNTTIPDEELMGSNIVLKTKPIVKHSDKYIIPSFSMLTWCVEPAIEDYIKSSPKLSNKYKDIKHEFLLRKGLKLLKEILPNAMFYPENLYYDLENGDKCETDGLISYNDTLFIIEAKGHRLTTKAKGGNYQRTENHLNDIIGDSTAQGRRAAEYILSKEKAVFLTKKNEQILIERQKYKDIITVSLILEPIGNLTPLMKVANDLNYFKEHELPFIISIYDLIVFADHIEIPILFLHYLKRRRRFLEVQNAYVFEEIDLLGYYLSNGLYIEHTLERAQEEKINMLAFDNQTDEFNDFYMYKYGHKEKFTPKMKSFLSIEFKTILKAIEKSEIPNKGKIMLEMLDVTSQSVKKLTEYIKTIKRQFVKDGQLHDCSIGTTGSGDNIGITYMVGPNKSSVEASLINYCKFKYAEQQASLWIGIGDVSTELDDFDFQCSLVLN